MQEINLLQTKIQDRHIAWQRKNQTVNVIFVLILILELGLGGGLYFLEKSVQAKTKGIEAENVATKSRININQRELGGAKSFQAQLKNIRTLVENHIHWSGFFDELTKTTFNRAQLISLGADIEGKIHMEGHVSTYTDLSKFILGLNTSDKFTAVKLLAVQPGNDKSGYTFSLDLTVSNELLIK